MFNNLNLNNSKIKIVNNEINKSFSYFKLNKKLFNYKYLFSFII